jgi:hypothetical protein
VASQSVIRLVDVLPISKKPELVIIYDLNDYPVSARCSACGAVMPQRQEWITSAAENLEWFANQFRLHLESDGPDWGAALKNPGQLVEFETAGPDWGAAFKNSGRLVEAMAA